ncbi:hypothetical protein GCM10010171_44870 [Actinokineospora fastidiosa]|uniref:Uncharacterized protein n=1 Tax=Actinokineospora fastidiosa TaxID=1816 RepID=A0A918GLL3_9PSEU|nr:hypothetical protein GCM10010171_44870 [Actinokineospora fastidiosa]
MSAISPTGSISVVTTTNAETASTTSAARLRRDDAPRNGGCCSVGDVGAAPGAVAVILGD